MILAGADGRLRRGDRRGLRHGDPVRVPAPPVRAPARSGGAAGQARGRSRESGSRNARCRRSGLANSRSIGPKPRFGHTHWAAVMTESRAGRTRRVFVAA